MLHFCGGRFVQGHQLRLSEWIAVLIAVTHYDTLTLFFAGVYQYVCMCARIVGDSRSSGF